MEGLLSPYSFLWDTGEDLALWVEQADGSAVALINEGTPLEVIRDLNWRGMRQQALLHALMAEVVL